MFLEKSMKLYIKIKGVKYKLVKENLKNAIEDACTLCEIPNDRQCKKVNKLCRGQNHFFVEKFKKEKHS